MYKIIFQGKILYMIRAQNISKLLILTTHLRSVDIISAIGEERCQVAQGYAACHCVNRN